MKRNDLRYTIRLAGPLLTQSSEPEDFGMDIVVAKNSDGKPYIPGTLISGKLDQAWQEISDATSGKDVFSPDLMCLLGKTSQNGQPFRKQLFFSDIIFTGRLTGKFIHNRVTIDNERGAACNQHLVFIDSPFLEGEEYDFEGTVSFFSTKEDSSLIEGYLKTGLQWLSQTGAMRTIGYGRVKKVEFKSFISNTIPAPSTPVRIQDKIGLEITPEHPFCLAAKPVADNLFESTDFIPGSALIGSIMTTWNFLTNGQVDKEREELREHFNNLRITHAFPSDKAGKRPVVFPKSLVKIKTGKKKMEILDAAICEKPFLYKGKTPLFSIDWKDYFDVTQEFGWTQLHKELRIRTAIDPKTLRSAKEELFAYELVVPKEHSWYAELDLGKIDATKREVVFSQLNSLLSHGLIGLGKTKTPAVVEFILPPASIQPVKSSDLTPVNSNQWIITLQSDTLLGSPEHLDETSGAAELKKMYEETWSELSGGKLKLVRYFASQRLNGGTWRRETNQQGQQYCPWLLTEAGSVFVLEADESSPDDARKMVKEWFEHGLPVKGEVCKYYNINPDPDILWKTCPFIPQNGYGEIAVNLAVHTKNKPPQPSDIDVLKEEDISNGS